MSRKGFPESYDVRSLLAFLADAQGRASAEVRTPVYSHLTYDIVDGGENVLRRPRHRDRRGRERAADAPARAGAPKQRRRVRLLRLLDLRRREEPTRTTGTSTRPAPAARDVVARPRSYFNFLDAVFRRRDARLRLLDLAGDQQPQSAREHRAEPAHGPTSCSRRARTTRSKRVRLRKMWSVVWRSYRGVNDARRDQGTQGRLGR